MSLSRRGFCLGSMGLLLAGCAGDAGPATGGRTMATVPTPAPRPDPAPAPPSREPSEETAAADRAGADDPGSGPLAGLDVIPRRRWAEAPPDPSRLGPLDGVARITVHHEGWNPVLFTSVARTAERLATIRDAHRRRLHAGDIGYHFVIDRAGRIWEGRPLRYQGAHVEGHNAHNLGVMVLGNFERQRPSPDQLGTLYRVLDRAMRHYGVGVRELHTHRELNPTLCPGRYLQQRMDAARRRRFS